MEENKQILGKAINLCESESKTLIQRQQCRRGDIERNTWVTEAEYQQGSGKPGPAVLARYCVSSLPRYHNNSLITVQWLATGAQAIEIIGACFICHKHYHNFMYHMNGDRQEKLWGKVKVSCAQAIRLHKSLIKAPRSGCLLWFECDRSSGSCI